MTKLLVASGSTTKTEVLSIDSTEQQCLDLPDYPMNIRESSGGFLAGNIPIICGGVEYINQPLKQCYALNISSQHWINIGNLTTGRNSAGSVVIYDSTTLWITGGYGDANVTSDFVSLTSNAFAITRGPDLPTGFSGHCMVKLFSLSVDPRKTSRQPGFSTLTRWI